MAKYDPLLEYLEGATRSPITLSFREVERLLNATLPVSARKHAAWWSNEPVGSHVQARAWMDAGWVARVDIAGQSVEFRRTR